MYLFCLLRAVRVQFLGLHVHSGESSDHNHSHEEGLPDYVSKMLVLIAGIYYFYLMETIFSLITYKKNHHHHQHHHGVRETARCLTLLTLLIFQIVPQCSKIKFSQHVV